MIYLGILIGITLSVLVVFVLSKTKKSAEVEVPVTYTLGWWAQQNDMEITGFKVVVEDAELNLFKSSSRIAYTVTVRLHQSGAWQPYIKNVHLCEKPLRQELDGSTAEIHITPVVHTRKSKSPGGEPIIFEFTNRHVVHSRSWGTNRITLICGNFREIIELEQRK